ncbi:hypothetical protein [Absidia glauca]|uniref:FHA domain-containing protein n=1 Tax=Absidia glauca TaxID=4829 RepID=A0A168S644_ABSGL|nr:hypothetical protein [Absidia glauca]
MTELMSQTQLVEDTNRFGKHKAGYGSNRTFPPNGNNGNHHTSSNGASNNESGRSPGTLSSPTSSSSHAPSSGLAYTVVLQPYNSHFSVKTIQVKENVRCRIGRQSSTKTIPRPLNGYFDSKVLSRNHALLWLGETGGVWIKDTKSSNGTFLNGHRLSPELEESDPYELKTGDQIEFGIDITGEDGSILYHKVACSVSIFNIPVEQMDPSTLKEFNISNGYASLFATSTSDVEPSHQRRGSASSVSTISYHSGKATITDHSSNSVTKRNKNWEMLIAKLEGELERSQQVEKELHDLKDVIGDMNKTQHTEDRLKKSASRDTTDLTLSLQHQLDKAHGQLAIYAEKSRLQDLAITSAQKQLMELRLIIEKKPKNTGMDESEVAIWRQKVEQIRLEMDEAKLKHSKALLLEKERCTDYEQRCLQLEKRLVGLEQRSPVSSTQDTGFFSGLMDALHGW